MQAEQLLTSVLERPTYASRARDLRAGRPFFSASLGEGLLGAATACMRTDPAEARQRARLALHVARRLEDVAMEGRALRTLSQAALLIGRFPESLRAIDDALALLRPAGGAQERAELRALRVQALTQLERFAEAEEVGRQVLRTFEERNDVRGVIRIRLALANLAKQLDKPRDALRQFRQVEWLLPHDSPVRLRATVAANRAAALQACNRFRAAARWFQIARDMFEAEGCDHTTASMDYNLAYSAVLRGRYDEALDRYAAIEERLTELGDGMRLAHIDLDRAEVHLFLNLPEDARGFAERASAAFEELGLDKDRAQAAYFAARAAAMTGELQAAASGYALARELFAGLGLAAREVGCAVQQAYTAQRLGLRSAARRFTLEARALVEGSTNPLENATVSLLRANLALAAKQYTDALSHARMVLVRCRRVHAPWMVIEARRVEARAYASGGNAKLAIASYQIAIDVLERQRAGVPPDEYMTAFLGARAEMYEALVQLLCDAGDVEQAFAYTERAKSRALLDMLAGESVEAPTDGLHATRIRVVREALNALYWKLLRSGGGAEQDAVETAATVNTRAGELEGELQSLLRAQGRGGTTAGAVAVPSPRTLRRHLAADTVLIDYLVTKTGLVAFVVTREEVRAQCIAVGAGEIEERLGRFRFHLAKHERPSVVAEDLVLRATRDNLSRLAEMVLDPIADTLRGKRLVISPHGPLHGLPFHALPWGDGWLCDRFEVLYTPSAAVYHHCKSRVPQATGDAAVFGVPDEGVPQVESESRAVAALLGTRDLKLGADASFAKLREAAGRARILHIATHGMFRRSNPRLSAIRLGDGWVTPYDLGSLCVTGELVVVSSCESGVAGWNAGNEIQGLARGFLSAGAPALLCSQWRVHDGAAATFMQAFYEALRDGRDAAAAQRDAMAVVRADYPHPYYWAPFFLMGATTPRTAARSLHASTGAASHQATAKSVLPTTLEGN